MSRLLVLVRSVETVCNGAGVKAACDGAAVGAGVGAAGDLGAGDGAGANSTHRAPTPPARCPR